MSESANGQHPEQHGVSEQHASRAEQHSPRPGRHVPRRRRADERVRRLPVLVAIVALVVIAAAIGNHRGRVTPAAAQDAATVPVAAPASALSSSWFCAGATGDSQGAAPGQLVIANASARAVTGTVTVIPSQGARSTRTVTVAAFSRLTVAETTSKPAPWLGAVVNLDGGDTSVEQETGGTLGPGSEPCATSGSPQWYFPSGITLRNAETYVSLLNPYQQTAVVDLSFTTENGLEEPGSLQGIVVPADGLVTVSLASALPRRSQIATTVTARSGRVVAWKTEVVEPPKKGEAIFGATQAKGSSSALDPVPPVGGLTVTLGASATHTRWWWADGVVAPGVTENYFIYNPGTRTAQVSLAVHLEAGKAEPFRLSIAPKTVATVDANQQSRIPSGVAYSATLTSLNGVGVVAERLVSATTPSTRSGLGELLGDPLSARQWLLGAGVADASTDEWVVLTNTGRRAVTASFSELSGGASIPVPKLGGLRIAAGARLGVNVNQAVAHLDNALIVRASGPVVVERDLYAAKGRGISLAPGVPLGLSPVR